MKNSKGFTLLELVVIIAIIGVLAVVSVPTLTQYINRSKVGVCEANRQEFLHSFIAYQSSGNTAGSLEQAIAGTVPEMLTDKNNLKCPSSGTYSVVNGSIVCSVHGAIGSAGSGSGSTTLVAGDTILDNIVLDDLKASCVAAKASERQGIHLISPGQVFVSGGNTYAVGWSTWLSHSAAQAFLENGTIPNVLIKIDTVNTVKPESCKYVNYHWVWNPAVQLGTVYYDNVNKVSYYFIGTNGATDQLPASGGNWIRLQ